MMDPLDNVVQSCGVQPDLHYVHNAGRAVLTDQHPSSTGTDEVELPESRTEGQEPFKRSYCPAMFREMHLRVNYVST